MQARMMRRLAGSGRHPVHKDESVARLLLTWSKTVKFTSTIIFTLLTGAAWRKT